MKKLKKFLIYSFVAAILSLIFSFIKFDFINHLQPFDNKIQDFMFKFRGKISDTNNIVIIDIDEKSLHQLGQWPWGRDIIAKILQNLSKTQIAAIGLDIVFAER